MKIFGLINNTKANGVPGPQFHRVLMPLLLMPDVDVYVTNAVEEKDFEQKKPDAIYYSRINISDEVLRLQGKYHFRIVVDVDDWWHLDPHHIMFKHSKENNHAAHHEKHLRIADAVTTTHERLAEQVYKFNKNVVVVPNAIPRHEYFPTEHIPSSGGLKRIFWQGSVTHEADVNLLRNTVKKLDPACFQMIMAGYTNEVAWERMADCYTNYQKMPNVVLPGMPSHEYYRYYGLADICVVPLLSTKFNTYKSNLKVLEAANMGLPVIASNVHPYKNMEGVMYVDRSSDWLRWLNVGQAVWDDHAAMLATFCKREFDFDTINLKRKEVFV